jgi:predicted ATP-grasp superfamily ATP-dependent carboligase
LAVLTKTDSPQTAIPARLRGRGAVVIGGDCGAVGVVRSLGRAGIPTVFLSGKNPLAGYSRYTTHRLSWPGAEHADALGWLKDLAVRDGLEGWTLFPCGDEEVRLVSQQHDELSAVFRMCTPPWETTRWFADKTLTYRKAAELEIEYPQTYDISDPSDLSNLDFRFPLVLKPAIKAGDNALTQSKVWRVADRDMLLRFYDDAVSMAGSGGLIVQELVPGNGSTQFSYAAVCRDGRPVLSMVARRLRQHPANYGTGTFVETVDDVVIEAQAERLLAGVGYSGMVEMEFKLDLRDGSYKLLDVNPRAWTWNSIGDVAGLDFPMTMWRLAQRERVPRMRARSGAYWMYLSRDFPEACREIFAGRLSPSDYLRSFFKPIAFATFAIDDPKPWLIDLPMSLRRWFAKGYRH